MTRSKLIERHRLKRTTGEKSFVYAVSVMSASNYANGVLGVFSVSPDSVRLHGTEGGLQWFPEGLKRPFRSEAVGQGQRGHPQAFSSFPAHHSRRVVRQHRVLHLPARLSGLRRPGAGREVPAAEPGPFH